MSELTTEQIALEIADNKEKRILKEYLKDYFLLLVKMV